MEGRFWQAGEGGRIACSLCPHACSLAPGAAGLCRVRRNDAGRLSLPFYGAVSSAALDPIEKKPLYHFLPGSSVYSAGYLGCNLKCPFCQNCSISQSTDAPCERVSPEALVESALRSGCPSVAHTYSEPMVHAEFVIEAMRLARNGGLRNVLVTNGCAREEAAREVLSRCDAVNVDLKCWDPVRYRRVLGGDLDAVMAFIALAVGMGVHVEATTLVVPGLNDEDGQIAGIAEFLSSLSPDLPLHLSAYRPMYRYREPATRPETVARLAAVAGQRLGYVYPWNGGREPIHTRCRSCQAILVSRQGYRVDDSGLDGRNCRRCGEPSPIVAA